MTQQEDYSNGQMRPVKTRRLSGEHRAARSAIATFARALESGQLAGYAGGCLVSATVAARTSVPDHAPSRYDAAHFRNLVVRAGAVRPERGRFSNAGSKDGPFSRNT